MPLERFIDFVRKPRESLMGGANAYHFRDLAIDTYSSRFG